MNRKQRRAAIKQGKPAARDIRQIFADAVEHHRAGRLNEAERLYRQALAIDPRHADSLHLLGVIAHQTQHHDLAVELIGGAIAIDPSAAAYHSNLGNALRAQGRLDEAVASYRRALSFKPDYPEAHNNLGLALNEQGKTGEAVTCYRAAIVHRPDYANAHDNLGVALQALGQTDEAIACHRSALELEPHLPEAHNNLGNALRQARQLDDAVDRYGRAVNLKPDYADAYDNLGLALHSGGRFDEAFAAHEMALRLGADPYRSYYALSQCRKFTEADRSMVAAMTTLRDAPDAPNTDRSLLHFALGKIFDDLAEHKNAIRHFDEANRLEAKTRYFDKTKFTALVDELIGALPKEATIAPLESDSELLILIVGMPRSGTTLVEQILASHPTVSTGGELDFWLQRLTKMESTTDAIEGYCRLLSGIAPDAVRVIDKMPYNFLALGLLQPCFPKARIIHCRRNPVDTALSIYFTRFSASTGFSGLNDFAYRRDDIVFFYREYCRLMAHWHAVLPPDRFLEIDYEQLVAAPEPVSRHLVAFCGLEWDATCLDFHKAQRAIDTASAWQARQPIYRTSTERWRRYEPWLGELRELMISFESPADC